MRRHSAAFVAITLLLGFTACGGGPQPQATDAAIYKARVAWSANRERTVNGPGGGYRVYYSSGANAAPSASKIVDVPWVSGDAPTSVLLEGLAPGTWYVRVIGYSPLSPPGKTGGNTSAYSQEISVTVP